MQAKPGKENAALANEALDLAIKELEKTDDLSAKLSTYFLAAGMYKKLGEIEKAAKCDAVLNNAISLCESSKTANEVQISSVSQLLNTMACHIIYVQIPEGMPARKSHEAVRTFSQNEFEASEKLRLRASRYMGRQNFVSADWRMWICSVVASRSNFAELHVWHGLRGFGIFVIRLRVQSVFDVRSAPALFSFHVISPE